MQFRLSLMAVSVGIFHSAACMAHEFTELKIANWAISSDAYIRISFDETVKGSRFICAVYGEKGLITSDDGYTENLATTKLLRVGDNLANTVERAVCVFDD